MKEKQNLDKLKNYLLSNMKQLAQGYNHNEFYHLVCGLSETVLNESFHKDKITDWSYYSSSIYGYLQCCEVILIPCALDCIAVLERETLKELIIVEEFLPCANIVEACRLFRDIFEK